MSNPQNLEVFPDAEKAAEKTPDFVDSTSYTGPDRRQEMRIWRAEVNRRLDEGSAVMKSLRDELSENTKATTRIEADTSELVTLLQSFKGAFKVLDLIGSIAKPVGAIIAFCVAAYGFIQSVKTGLK